MPTPVVGHWAGVGLSTPVCRCRPGAGLTGAQRVCRQGPSPCGGRTSPQGIIRDTRHSCGWGRDLPLDAGWPSVGKGTGSGHPRTLTDGRQSANSGHRRLRPGTVGFGQGRTPRAKRSGASRSPVLRRSTRRSEVSRNEITLHDRVFSG